MTKEAVVEKMISVVENYMAILRDIKKIPEPDLKNDVLKSGGLKHYLYVVAQSTIDLAEAIIAHKKLRRPSTLSETFVILNESNLIDRTLTDKLVKMAGFRNLLAHDYENVDFHKIYSFLQNDLGDIEEFLKEIQTKLKV